MGKYLKENLGKLDIDLAKEHWLILMFLQMEGKKHQQEIADFLFKDKGTIARAIQVLEQNGLIERQHDPEDKRQKLLSLTPKGEVVSLQFPPISKQLESIALKGLSEEQINEFKNTLTRIYFNLK